MSKPPWLNKQSPVLHKESGVCFMPVQLKSNGQLFAIDALSNLYAIDECEAATPDSFTIPRKFINNDESVTWVERTPRGLSINGHERVRLKDEVDTACDRLAEFFKGAIVEQVPEKFQVQEVREDVPPQPQIQPTKEEDEDDW